MGLVAALVGGIAGTSIHMMSNATRKIPISRSKQHFCVCHKTIYNVSLSKYSLKKYSFIVKVPWMHVGLFFVGAWAGNKYVQVEQQLVQDINEIRADRGLPPLAGTSSWILRYSTVNSDSTLAVDASVNGKSTM
jgi:hypothetical protein